MSKGFGTKDNDKKYTIIELEDFVPPQHADEIQALLESSHCDWNFNPETSNMEIPEKLSVNVMDSHQMTHLHFNMGIESQSFIGKDVDVIRSILLLAQQKLKFEVVNIRRIKSNLLSQWTGFTKDNYSAPHIDYYDEHYDENYSIIYYVNDSDGDTRFFNKKYDVIKKVTPKKGKAVLFHSNTLHAGSNPIESRHRIVIKFNVRLRGIS